MITKVLTSIGIVTIFSVVTVLTLSFVDAIHIIYEGNLGMYTRGGALIEGVQEPGLGYMVPFITNFHQVQVTLQTDQVQNIPCGTSSGVLIYFDKIEVVNKLKKEYAWDTIKNYTIQYDQTWIFDKIHHEINQFCSKHTLHEVLIDKFDMLDESLQDSLQQGCSKWAPGIEIISVRVTKPRIPQKISQNYIQTEAEKTQLLIAQQQQKINEEENLIKQEISKMEAEADAEISIINAKTQLLIQEGDQKIATIQDEIALEKQKVKAEAEYYEGQKIININQRKLTPKYEQYQNAMQIKGIKKTYFGNSLNDYYQENNIIRD